MLNENLKSSEKMEELFGDLRNFVEAVLSHKFLREGQKMTDEETLVILKMLHIYDTLKEIIVNQQKLIEVLEKRIDKILSTIVQNGEKVK